MAPLPPHGYAYEIETSFSVHNCVGPVWTKATLESEYNSHESEVIPSTNSILTQRPVGCW